MKKQFKALALTIALMATTACGQNQAQAPQTQIKAASSQSESETKVTAIDAPNTGIKEQEKVQTNFLIPQTLELEEDKKAAAKDEVLAEAKEESAIEVVEEAVEEEVKEASTIEVIEEEVVVENKEVEETSAIKVASAVEEVPSVVEVASAVEEVPSEVEVASAVEEVPSEIEVASAVEVAYEEQETYLEEIAYAPVAVETENTVEEEVSAPAVEIVESEADEVEEVTEVAGGLTVASPSVEEVRAYWTNYVSKAASTEDFYGIQLVNQKAVNDGKQVSRQAQEDALHITNTVRFASGLKAMSLGDEQASYAQAATIVNKLNNSISHTPAAPAGLDQKAYQEGYHGAENSNLASNYDLLDAVLAYIKDDIGSLNQAEVGHRRWMLDPSASQTGFGQTEEFSAMFVNNNNYQGQNADQVVAYPGETAISEFHSEASSLSIQFGENFDITNAEVTVTDLATGEVRTDSHIDQSLKGNGRSITFGNGMNYAPGTKLAVKVEGVTKDGQAYPVEYTINYMSIAQ